MLQTVNHCFIVQFPNKASGYSNEAYRVDRWPPAEPAPHQQHALDVWIDSNNTDFICIAIQQVVNNVLQMRHESSFSYVRAKVHKMRARHEDFTIFPECIVIVIIIMIIIIINIIQ